MGEARSTAVMYDDETLRRMREEVTPHLEYLRDIGVIKSYSFDVAPDVIRINWTGAYARLLRAGRRIDLEEEFAAVCAGDDRAAIRAWIEREASETAAPPGPRSPQRHAAGHASRRHGADGRRPGGPRR